MRTTLDSPVPKSFIDREVVNYRTKFAEDLSFGGNVLVEGTTSATIVSFETFGKRKLENKVKVWVQDRINDSIQDEIATFELRSRDAFGSHFGSFQSQLLPPFLYTSTSDFSLHMFVPYDALVYKSRMYTIEGDLHLYHALPTRRQMMIREATGSKKGICMGVHKI